MRSSLWVAVLALLCSACASWQFGPPKPVHGAVAARPFAPQSPPVAEAAPFFSEVAIARSPVTAPRNDPERFICSDGLPLDVSYSADRQIARISTGGATVMSFRRIPREGYLADEFGVARFMRVGPRALFVSEPAVVTVKPGDTLGGIARRVWGDASRAVDIASANSETLSNPDLIHVGQVLQLPQWRRLCRRTLK